MSIPRYTTATTSATNSSATAIDNFRLGTLTGGFVGRYDRLRGDDAAEPARVPDAGPPVVSAGPDLTKETGGAPFTITAVEAPGAAAITTRAWRVVSGTAVTLTNATTQTVTVTPPSAAGATVLGYKVIDANSVDSTEDTATITWVAPGQSFRPVGDVTVTGWTATPTATPTSNNIDETTPDATDYVASPNGPTGQEAKWRLEPKPAPLSTSGVFLEVQLWLSAAATTQSTVVTLYDSDGTTVRKQQTFTDLTTTPTLRQIALTSGEAAAITGWASGLVVGVAPTLT